MSRTGEIERYELLVVAGAKTLGATRGLFKAVVERDSDRILGAAILAANGAGSSRSSRPRCSGGLGASVLRDAVLAHPTMVEGLNTLFASWVD